MQPTQGQPPKPFVIPPGKKLNKFQIAGYKRAASITAERRRAIAQTAAAGRWRGAVRRWLQLHPAEQKAQLLLWRLDKLGRDI